MDCQDKSLQQLLAVAERLINSDEEEDLLLARCLLLLIEDAVQGKLADALNAMILRDE